MSDTAQRAAERAARESYGRLLAFLAARTRDVAGAEDALAEAFASALTSWPEQGVPANPDAWLLTVARRRQTDAYRRVSTSKSGEMHLTLMREELDDLAMTPEAIPDRRLALMFACAHPEIDPALRSALILQTILGLTAADIGAAFLIPAATMGQRLVRAKSRIAELGIAFEIPDTEDLHERLDAVLEAIYAAYAKGWNDLVGEAGGQLAEEAIWLGRLVVALLPTSPEAKGMLALMLYSHARRAARRNPTGAYVPLDEQNTALWDMDAIEAAESLLSAASSAGPTGRCQLEAAIQSAHVVRLTGTDNWPVVVKLYDILHAMTGSPVVLLNRAAALAETEGPAAALQSIASLAEDKRMADYQPYWAVRGRLLAETGNREAAHEALTLAMGLSTDPAIREWLEARRAELIVG